jgi:hypothetical protein
VDTLVDSSLPAVILLVSKEAGIGAGGLVGLAAAQAEAARKAVERAMLGPEPPWLKHRPVLKKEFEVCAANGGGAVTDSGSDAEGDSDEAGEPVRAYDVLRLMRGSDFDGGGGARQVGLLKMVVRVLSSPPLDALGYGPDDAAGPSQLSAWTPPRAAHFDDTASEASRASEDRHSDDGHGTLAMRGNGAARRAVADEHVSAWWHDLTSAALAATHGGGSSSSSGSGGGAASKREDERLAMRRARLNPPRSPFAHGSFALLLRSFDPLCLPPGTWRASTAWRGVAWWAKTSTARATRTCASRSATAPRCRRETPTASRP